MNRRLFLLLFLGLSFPALAGADVFEGQVASVDASQGTVAVRYRDPAGQGVVERTFHIPPGQAPASIGVPTLNDVRVGDQVQVTASNQNGSWQVMSLVSNPGRLGPNSSNVVIAGPTLPAGAATAKGPFLPVETTPSVSGTSSAASPFTQALPGTFPTTTLSTGASGTTAGGTVSGSGSANTTGSTGGTTGASASGSAGGASGAS